MQQETDKQQSADRRAFGVLGLGLMLLLLGASGCAHSGDVDTHEPGFVRVFAPRFPDFIRAPMGLLLTNSGGFSAVAEVRATLAFSDAEQMVSGQLLSRGNKLLFAPHEAESKDKPERGGGFMFIWDVPAGTGFVISEALQGYAPFSNEMRVTNVAAHARPGTGEKVAGHSCIVSDVTMQSSDGTTAEFDVARAADINNVPVQMRSHATTNMIARTVTLSKILLQVPAADLFAPPEGFTRYSSAEAMADEIAARKRNLRRGNRGALEPIEMPPPGSDHR